MVSQQVPQPPTRDQIVQGLEEVLAGLSVALTASTGDILDMENAIFYSDPDVLSLAIIPLHPSSPSWEAVAELVKGEDPGFAVPFAALYLEGTWPGLPELTPGAYTLKLKADRSIIAVKEGEEIEIFCGCWQITEETSLRTDRVFSNVSFEYVPAPAPVVASSSVASLSPPAWYLAAKAVSMLIASAAALITAIGTVVGGDDCPPNTCC